jgi:hypothetical protein
MLRIEDLMAVDMSIRLLGCTLAEESCMVSDHTINTHFILDTREVRENKM